MIKFFESVLQALGVVHTINEGDLWGFLAILFILTASCLFLFAKSAPASIEKPLNKKEPLTQHPIQDKIDIVSVPKGPTWLERLQKGLNKSRTEFWGKLETILSNKKLDQNLLEEIEELLYGADMGPEIVSELVTTLQEKSKKEEVDIQGFKSYLYDFLKSKMVNVQVKLNKDLYQFDSSKPSQTKVIMIVGVNGVGKTTTIGKLATKLTKQGAKVVVGACDTFRAAAVDQLQIWCDRAQATMIRAKEGSRPSGVAYEALSIALQEKADYCILDTAGRLHTKENLMEELVKNKSVLSKLDPNAPHEILLVLDAITGQNALKQAEEFHRFLNLTGLILTKCDGSSKAGGAVGIVSKLQVPITYIGVGESVEDLNIFSLEEYLDALLSIENPVS